MSIVSGTFIQKAKDICFSTMGKKKIGVFLIVRKK